MSFRLYRKERTKIKLFFYVYPIQVIQTLFPIIENVYNVGFYDAQECGILRGFNASMVRECGQVYEVQNHIDEERGYQIFRLYGSEFKWSSQLGMVLEVDEKQTENCWFVDKEYDYFRISSRHSSKTIGGIINIQRPTQKIKEKRRLTYLIGQSERGTSNGNMAFGH